VLRVLILPISTIFWLDFETVLAMWYFSSFIFITHIRMRSVRLLTFDVQVCEAVIIFLKINFIYKNIWLNCNWKLLKKELGLWLFTFTWHTFDQLQ
jgi:hypothetical protein